MEKLHAVLKNCRQPVMITLILMLLCGLIFPLIITGLAEVVFPHQAGGSLIEVNGEAVGSEHVGQAFTRDCFMKGRPSAVQYNTWSEDSKGNKTLPDGTEFTAPASGSDNYAPSNPALEERVKEDMDAFLKEHPDVKAEDIPTDLLTASGSGLDPDISPESARVQIPALAEASGLSEAELNEIVDENTKGKLLGIFGEETVNVLKVNLDIAEKMGLI